jgi:hypothetical protein
MSREKYKRESDKSMETDRPIEAKVRRVSNPSLTSVQKKVDQRVFPKESFDPSLFLADLTHRDRLFLEQWSKKKK